MNSNSGFSITRPNGIAICQLLALKGAIRLESIGMKHSSGALRPRWAAKLGLKPRDSHAKYIETIEARVKEIEAKGDLGITSIG